MSKGDVKCMMLSSGSTPSVSKATLQTENVIHNQNHCMTASFIDDSPLGVKVSRANPDTSIGCAVGKRRKQLTSTGELSGPLLPIVPKLQARKPHLRD